MTQPRAGVVGRATAVFGAKVVQSALMFVTSVVVSRELGPAGRGIYFAPLLAVSTVVAISHLGLDQANVFLWGTERVPPRRLIGQAGAVALIAGALGAIALVLLRLIWPALFAESAVVVVAVAAAMVPVGVYTIYATGLLTLGGRPVLPVLVNCGIACAQLVGLAAASLAHAATPSTFFLVTALATMAGGIALAVFLAPARDWMLWDSALLRRSVAHSLVLHIGSTLLFLHLRIDMFLVAALLGPAALGLYSLAVVLAESLMLLTDSLATSLLPRQMNETGAAAAVTALAGARVAGMMGIGLSIGWAVVGKPLLHFVFGSDFDVTYWPLLILLPGITALGMQRMCGAAVLRAGTPWRITGLQALGFTVNVLLNLLLIPIAGINGAAAASTVSYMLMATAFLRWTSGLAGAPASDAIPGMSDALFVYRSLRALLNGGVNSLAETPQQRHV